jgi:hypothetical protein
MQRWRSQHTEHHQEERQRTRPFAPRSCRRPGSGIRPGVLGLPVSVHPGGVRASDGRLGEEWRRQGDGGEGSWVRVRQGQDQHCFQRRRGGRRRTAEELLLRGEPPAGAGGRDRHRLCRCRRPGEAGPEANHLVGRVPAAERRGKPAQQHRQLRRRRHHRDKPRAELHRHQKERNPRVTGRIMQTSNILAECSCVVTEIYNTSILR